MRTSILALTKQQIFRHLTPEVTFSSSVVRRATQNVSGRVVSSRRPMSAPSSSITDATPDDLVGPQTSALRRHGADADADLDQERTRWWYRATISSKRRLSPTVTGLTLDVNANTPLPTATAATSRHRSDDGKDAPVDRCGPPFSFRPGQWVDVYIPPLDRVGGYSIVSLPSALPSSLDLAVKASRHPAARWVTDEARPGDAVVVRVGGDFVYQGGDAENGEKRLLFIAGGVGINPLYGMLQQLHADAMKEMPPFRAALLYSASTEDELLFNDELKAIERELPDTFRTFITVTGKTRGSDGEQTVRQGRIDAQLVRDALSWLCRRAVGKGENENKSTSTVDCINAVYICGPPGMGEDMTAICCDSFDVDRSNVHFEQWW